VGLEGEVMKLQDAPIFTLVLPDGTRQEIYATGKTAGFPEGTTIKNGVMPLINYARGLLKESINLGLVTNEQAACFEFGFPGAEDPPLPGGEWPQVSVPPYGRLLLIKIQNDTIGDDIFAPEVIAVLRKYLDVLEKGKAGKTGYDRVQTEGGTVLTTIVGIPAEEQSLHQGPLRLRLPDGRIVSDGE
jgi:hypothetical protein